MGLAGNEEHAQVFTYPFRCDHHAIVGRSELARGGCQLDLQNILTGVGEMHGDADPLIDLRTAQLVSATLSPHPQRDPLARVLRPARFPHSNLDVAALAYDRVLGCDEHLDTAIELVGTPGQESMDRSIEAERSCVRRHVVDL